MSIFNKTKLLINKLVKNITLISLITTATLTAVQAADNPKPSSWRSVEVKVTETFGNNQSSPLRGAKVIIDLVNRNQDSDGRTRFPQTKTSGSRGATFTRMPPSSMVGDYKITVIPKPSDKSNEFTCKEKSITFIHNMNKSNKQFRFKCSKTDSQNKRDRQTVGGYNLTVDVKQQSGKRGRSLWVAAYDNKNNRLKWVRTSGSHKATIKNVDPAKGPYKIVVHKFKNDRKPLFEGQFKMPKTDATFIADLDSGNGSSSGSNSGNNSGSLNKKSCHKVKIQKQEGKRSSAMSKACQQSDGNWKIESYKY